MRQTMSSDTDSTVKLTSKSSTLHINKKQYAKPHLNYLGKITEVTASGSGVKTEQVTPPSQGPRKKGKPRP